MKEYMDRTGRQLIIVAVECSHDPDNGRLKEYSPFPFTAPNTAIYMDYGANEINFHAVMRKQFRKVTDLLLSRDVLLTSRIVPNGDHCEACWEKQIPYFMDALFYPETR